MHLSFHLPTSPVTGLYRAWLSTLRYEQIGRDKIVQEHPAIACLWHDELFSCVAMKQNMRYMALISPSRDGDYLSAVMKGFGFHVVRGSSSRGGSGALHELIDGLRNGGYGIGITVDGPRGPRHKVKPGALWLSMQSGRPIVPVRTFYSRAKIFSSWDRFQLPLPFSRMCTVYGDPWYPAIDPQNPSSLRQACRELETRLNTLSLKDS